MASLNLIVSEIVHSLGEPNNYALRENVRNLVIQTRNEVIRRSFENHNYIDSVLQQKYKVKVEKVLDEDFPDDLDIEEYLKPYVFRTIQKVPKPIRFTNNLPFTRVSNVGHFASKEFPYIKETSARFREWLPGMRGQICYDYIDGYVYLFPNPVKFNHGLGTQSISMFNNYMNEGNIVIQAAFERPNEVARNSDNSGFEFEDDDNEWFLPEDMIGNIKDIILKRDLSNRHETNEVPNQVKMN